MANANAIVEKLKELGLRHGEKAGVAIASMVVFRLRRHGREPKDDRHIARTDQESRTAVAKVTSTRHGETRDHHPEARGKRNQGQRLRQGGRRTGQDGARPDNYKAAREWVTPEPGAGLIRDTPTLIAVTELYAYPGRGGILVYDLDEDGNRIPETDKDKDAAQVTQEGGADGGRPAG